MPDPTPKSINYFSLVQTVTSAVVIAILLWVGSTVSTLQKDVAWLGQKIAFLDERELSSMRRRLDQHDDRFKNITARIRILETNVLSQEPER